MAVLLCLPAMVSQCVQFQFRQYRTFLNLVQNKTAVSLLRVSGSPHSGHSLSF